MLTASLNKTFPSFLVDNLFFSSIGQDKSKLQKQISNLLILTEMAARKKRSKNDRGRKEMFYLTTHSTHYINSYIVADIILW